MKKAIIIIAIVAAVAVICTLLILRGWPGGLIGSGNLDTEEYAFTNFTKVEISTAFEFEIKQSSSYSINVTADDNVMDYVQVSQDGQTLKIRLGPRRLLGSVTLRASVTMPQLSDLTVSGASRGTVSDFTSTEDLNITVSGASRGDIYDLSSTEDVNIKVSGASRVTGDITAGNVEFDISGASTVQLEGSANDMVASVSGASRLNLDAFIVNNANVNFSGASSGTVNLNGRLDADLSGASKLWYIGEPTMGTINTSGASTVSKK
ncbi:MAG: head GIN domain-containing protein [Dehalococcoidia bacterium]